MLEGSAAHTTYIPADVFRPILPVRLSSGALSRHKTKKGHTTMGQVNVNPNPNPPRTNDDSYGAGAAASNNLTWGIAVVLIIAAIVVAIVYLSHNLHF